MTRNAVYSCTQCNTLNQAVFSNMSFLACKKCGHIVADYTTGKPKPSQTKIPDDWSFIQPGTTGSLNNNPFTVVGRCRLQLRNDYKNFWMCEYKLGSCFYLVESFGSFSFFTITWAPYEGDPSKLRAGEKIRLVDNEKGVGEYVEKCEAISYTGEIGGRWNFFSPGFFVVQASANTGKTGIFLIQSKTDVFYMIGEKIGLEKLQLKNIISWNEWK